jgi:CheY-like chemotaxis protein
LIGDSLRINQVLLNMVSNALKFTDAGRVCICCSVIDDRENEQRIRFEVCDTGIGIDPEKTEHIFDSFSQEDPSVARRFGGTGLGLAICRQLVQLMGGEISLSSEKGKGSVFRFELQLIKGTAADLADTEQVPMASKSLDGARILLAEDNQTNQYLMATLLNSWSIHVDIASNGFEAIDLLQNGRYDMVLMDIQMPLCDGIEATSIIRSRLGLKVPIIALTANALKGDEERYLEAGMDGYLSKPIEPNNLYSKISAALEFTGRAPVTRCCTFDLSHIRETFYGNEKQVAHLVNLFISESRSIAEAMLAAKDGGTIRGLAHKLKASLDTLHVTPLNEDVRRIERLASAEASPAELHNLLEQFHRNIFTLGDLLRNDLEQKKTCC